MINGDKSPKILSIPQRWESRKLSTKS